MPKRLIWFSLACLAYFSTCLLTFISLNKSTLELASYRTMSASIPGRIHDPMSQYEIDYLVSVVERVQFGGDLTVLGLNFDAEPAEYYLQPSSFDFQSSLALLKQGRLRAAQVKFDSFASKVDSTYERRLKLLLRLSALAGIVALVLALTFLWLLYRSKSRLDSEVELLPDEALGEESFSSYLQSVVEEEAKFSGHRAQLNCIGFDNGEFNREGQEAADHRETLELIAEQLVRNSIEHGGRLPETRLLAGKPEYLSIRVSLQDAKEYWLMSVWDNGEGLDGDRLLERALSLGLISEASAKQLEPEQRIKLIFLGGFTTRDRSVSKSDNNRTLAEIRAVLKSLKGVISVQNQVGVSCQFVIRFPKF